MSQITIMQLSDLHKEISAFPSNKAFVSSIISDIARYGNDKIHIPKPEIMVVCGDIVQGSNNPDFAEALHEIEQQYVEANDILNQVSSVLFGGNKHRIVIVPGNHDVSWPHSRRSMEKLESVDPNLNNFCRRPQGDIRQSWADFSFYRISDHALYDQRFVPFARFYSNFYDNQRTYSLNPEEQYDVFRFPECKTLFVGFSSCFWNDHLNTIGMIHPECIANCYNQISGGEFDNWLKIAVWHHDVHGIPTRSDFMDERTIQFLIDKGFHIGLHGHLHRDEIFEVKFSADQSLKMLVFGCGSFGATREAIPLGASNQYSILEVDRSSNRLRYHLRKALEQAPGLPIWMPGNIRQNRDKSYIDAHLRKHIIREHKMPAKSMLTRELMEIEILFSRKEYTEALIKLKTMDQENPFVRRYIVECFCGLDMDNELINFIQKPKTVTEFAYLAEALWRRNRIEELKKLVETVSSDQEIADSEPFKRMTKKLADRGN